MNFFKFAELCGRVKLVKRAGWLRYLPPERVESVADHSHRVAALCWAIPE
jgi:5'-deoxynucleotidase YfbR-like HD superfamily hydrolase